MLDSQQLEAAIWSISEGRGSDDDMALLRADERASLGVLDRLIIETEDDLEAVRTLPGEERDQVVADFTDTLDGLRGDCCPVAPTACEAAADPEVRRLRHARHRGVPGDACGSSREPEPCSCRHRGRPVRSSCGPAGRGCAAGWQRCPRHSA